MAKVLTATTAEQARADYEERALSLLAVKYDVKTDALRLTLSSGVRLSVPRTEVPPLAKASPEELALVHPGNGGATISQEDLDVDVFVPGLLDRLFGHTIRVELGRRSGRTSTPAKARAARKNGSKGGRPKKRAA
jgi:hypothetical protein